MQYMRDISGVLMNALAGAAGGALITILALNNPSLLQFFGRQPELVVQPGERTPGKDTGSEQLPEYETQVVAAVAKASPAVVSIVISRDVAVVEQYYEESPGNPFDPFGDLLTPFQFRVPQYRQRGIQRQEIGGGSGFLVSPDGMIVTNRHVVDQDDAKYTVFTNDGTKYDAEVVARDPANDLAIIRIQGSGLPFLELGDSNQLHVGQTAIAIGNALSEFRNTVSVGVISGLSRSIVAGGGQGQPEQLEEVIQTDAAINPGNSGGPLLNLAGQVVGVNVAVALGTENIGFALPVNIAQEVVNSVKETGRIVRPFLGVRYVMITAALQEQNLLPVDHGALLLGGGEPTELAIVPGSPADTAGLKEGDIILEIDGVALNEERSLAGIIRTKRVGDMVTLKTLRAGEERTVTMTLSETPS